MDWKQLFEALGNIPQLLSSGWNGILVFLLQVLLAGGGAAFILWKVIASWGEKWLDARFATRPQELQHVHDRELENVRYSIQSTFSRIKKIHDREFDVLPKIWFMIHDAFGQACYALNRTIIEHPSFVNMPDEEIAAYFASVGFSEIERKQILRSTRPDERSHTCYKVLMHRYLQ